MAFVTESNCVCQICISHSGLNIISITNFQMITLEISTILIYIYIYIYLFIYLLQISIWLHPQSTISLYIYIFITNFQMIPLANNTIFIYIYIFITNFQMIPLAISTIYRIYIYIYIFIYYKFPNDYFGNQRYLNIYIFLLQISNWFLW